MKYKFFYIITGALLVLDTVFAFCMQNGNAGVYLPAIMGLPLLIFGFFKEIRAFLQKGIGKWIKICFILGYSAFLVTFLLAMGLIISAKSSPQSDYNAIIVLGGGIRGETPSATLKSRLDQAGIYARDNPDALIVVSGAQGRNEYLSEALAMKKYLNSQCGISMDRILIEDQSFNTYQNLKFSKIILDKELGQAYKALIVTSDFHVFRTQKLATDRALNADVASAPSPWYMAPNNYLREYMAVYKYYLVGYT